VNAIDKDSNSVNQNAKITADHSWVRNLKNVAPQKQNTICKTRAQYTKCNCAFEQFKAHCTATINAKNASFHKKIFKRKDRNRNSIK
jgi:hypothetical protein